MAALDFPASPTNGQIYTSNGSSWTYDSTKVAWRSSPYEPGAAITSATAPTSPQNGDIWFDTDDGTTYVYYNDGTSSQWTEIRSEIATSKVGLVPIVPTSIAVGSGTASVAVDGTITFASCNYFDVAGVFSSSFANYHIMFEDVKVTAADTLLAYVMLNNGVANGTNFTYQRIYAQNTSMGTALSSGQAAGGIGVITGLDCSAQMTLYRPNKTQYTNSQSHCIYVRNESGVMKPFIENFNSTLADTTAYNGIRFYDGAGAISGKVKIYGYN